MALAFTGRGLFLTFLLVGILLPSSIQGTQGLECVYCSGDEVKESRQSLADYIHQRIRDGYLHKCQLYGGEGSETENKFQSHCKDWTNMEVGDGAYDGVTDFVCMARTEKNSKKVIRSCVPKSKSALGNGTGHNCEVHGEKTFYFCEENMCDPKGTSCEDGKTVGGHRMGDLLEHEEGSTTQKGDLPGSGAEGWGHQGGLAWAGRMILGMGLISFWISRGFIN